MYNVEVVHNYYPGTGSDFLISITESINYKSTRSSKATVKTDSNRATISVTIEDKFLVNLIKDYVNKLSGIVDEARSSYIEGYYYEKTTVATNIKNFIDNICDIERKQKDIKVTDLMIFEAPESPSE